MGLKNILKLIEKDKLFYPWSSEKETAELIKVLITISNPKKILEIGTFLGYMTLNMAVASSLNADIYTVDILDLFNHKYFKLLNKNVQNKIFFFNTTSFAAFNKFKNITFDLIYIDADHDFKACFADLVFSIKNGQKGTIILMHDALNHLFPGVNKSIKLLKIINFFYLNRLFDIVSLSTPIRKKDVPMSGLAVIKIKRENIFFDLVIYLVIIFIKYSSSYEKIKNYDLLKEKSFLYNDIKKIRNM